MRPRKYGLTQKFDKQFFIPQSRESAIAALYANPENQDDNLMIIEQLEHI